MRWLFLFLFGYRRVRLSCGGAELLTLLLSKGISVTLKSNSFILSLSDYSLIADTLLAHGATVSSPRGALPCIRSFLRLRFTVFALVFVILLNVFLSHLVFDIRVLGNEEIADFRIVNALSELGVYPGKPIFAIDTTDAEHALLSKMPQIAWVNINRRGTVLYVEVAERKGAALEKGKNYPSNIVAKYDCVIEEIMATSGRAVVEVGDVVRAGEVLITGIIESEGGTTFTRAEGVVTGVITDSICASATVGERKTVTERVGVCEVRLNILNFSANIFKNYRNLPRECDIITDKRDFYLGDGRKIPFGLVFYVAYSKSFGAEYTDNELVLLAHARHSERLNYMLLGSALQKIKTSAAWVNGTYTVSSDIVYIAPVAEEKRIEISGDIK